jgi:O-antigen/teichoic acid export membrane protein
MFTPVIFRHLFPRYTDIQFFQIALTSVFFVNLHAMNYEFIRGKQRAVAYTFYYTTSIFLFILLIHLIQDVYLDYHYISLAKSYLIASVLSCAISFIHVWILIGKTRSVKVEGMEWGFILRKSFPYFSNNAIYILIGTTDVFILSNYVAPAAIGEYSVLVKFATFISFPLIVISGNFAPKILHFQTKDRLSKEVARLTRLIFFGSFLLFISVLLVLPFVMDYLASEIRYGSWIFTMVGIGYLFSACCAMNEVSLLMLGHEKLHQKIMTLALLLNFLLNLLLIPLFGVIGAAATSMLTLIFWNVLAVYYARKKLNLSTSIIF